MPGDVKKQEKRDAGLAESFLVNTVCIQTVQKFFEQQIPRGETFLGDGGVQCRTCTCLWTLAGPLQTGSVWVLEGSRGWEEELLWQDREVRSCQKPWKTTDKMKKNKTKHKSVELFCFLVMEAGGKESEAAAPWPGALLRRILSKSGPAPLSVVLLNAVQ